LPDSLFGAGLYREAAIEYERVYYLTEDPRIRLEARIGRSNCHRRLGEYHEAVHDLDEVPVMQLNDSLRHILLLERVANHYLAGDFDHARSLLQQLLFYDAGKKGKDVLLTEILLALESYDYDLARESSIALLQQKEMQPPERDSLLRIISSLYEIKHRPRIVKPERAVMLSRFIPGSGQAVAGYPAEGAANFFLHALALGAGAYGILQAYYFTGYIVGAGMLQKLYFGGLKRTAFLAGQGNAGRTAAFNRKARALAMDIYKRE